MIPHGEILALRGEWNLRGDVIEKDYVLGWMLAAIAQQPELTDTWVFKGGTCLRKCYYETYRFSEDLDFTVIEGGPETPEDLLPIFAGVAERLVDQCGLEIFVDQKTFVRQRNRRGNPTTQGRVAFRGRAIHRACPNSRSTSRATRRSPARVTAGRCSTHTATPNR